MTLEQKQDIIVKNKDPVMAALQAVLDTYYNYLAPVTNNKNNVMTSLFKDQKAEKFAAGLKTDSEKYEKVLAKVKGDKPLTIKDIAYIGSAISFCLIRAKKQIESLMKANEMLSELEEILQSKLDS